MWKYEIVIFNTHVTALKVFSLELVPQPAMDVFNYVWIGIAFGSVIIYLVGAFYRSYDIWKSSSSDFSFHPCWKIQLLFNSFHNIGCLKTSFSADCPLLPEIQPEKVVIIVRVSEEIVTFDFVSAWFEDECRQPERFACTYKYWWSWLWA